MSFRIIINKIIINKLKNNKQNLKIKEKNHIFVVRWQT